MHFFVPRSTRPRWLGESIHDERHILCSFKHAESGKMEVVVYFRFGMCKTLSCGSAGAGATLEYTRASPVSASGITQKDSYVNSMSVTQ